jgi:hypothetical protein
LPRSHHAAIPEFAGQHRILLRWIPAQNAFGYKKRYGIGHRREWLLKTRWYSPVLAYNFQNQELLTWPIVNGCTRYSNTSTTCKLNMHAINDMDGRMESICRSPCFLWLSCAARKLLFCAGFGRCCSWPSLFERCQAHSLTVKEFLWPKQRPAEA